MINLKKEIQKYDIITFDIFDTLIKRNVKKLDDIFYYAALDVARDAKIANKFRIDRVNAEKISRLRLKTKEVNLDDIYSFLNPDKYDLDRIKQNEIAKEIELCQPILKMINLLNYAYSLNKTVYLISDMYLSEPVIKEMLRKCHINHFDKLYVSCEHNCNKLSGKLFSYVIDDNDLIPTQILHFGDSVKADYLGAKKENIKCHLVNKKKIFLKTLDRIKNYGYDKSFRN